MKVRILFIVATVVLNVSALESNIGFTLVLKILDFSAGAEE